MLRRSISILDLPACDVEIRVLVSASGESSHRFGVFLLTTTRFMVGTTKVLKIICGASISPHHGLTAIWSVGTVRRGRHEPIIRALVVPL